jgi:hypothetical protein
MRAAIAMRRPPPGCCKACWSATCLYTGVTRGGRLVVPVAEIKALDMAVKRIGSRTRLTRLAERIREAATATEAMEF